MNSKFETEPDWPDTLMGQIVDSVCGPRIRPNTSTSSASSYFMPNGMLPIRFLPVDPRPGFLSPTFSSDEFVRQILRDIGDRVLDVSQLSVSSLIGHVAALSRSFRGSVLLISKFPYANNLQRVAIFEEVASEFQDIVCHKNGCHVVKTVLESANKLQKWQIADKLTQRIEAYVYNMHSLLVVLTMIDIAEVDWKLQILQKLEPAAQRLLMLDTGMMAVRKLVEKLHNSYTHPFLVRSWETPGCIARLARSKPGCLLLEMCLTVHTHNQVRPIIDEALKRFKEMSMNNHSHNVVELAIEKGSEEDQKIFNEKIANNLLEFSIDDFAQRVVIKGLELMTSKDVDVIVEVVCKLSNNDIPVIFEMIQHRCGRCVVMTLVKKATKTQAMKLLAALQPFIKAIVTCWRGPELLRQLLKNFKE